MLPLLHHGLLLPLSNVPFNTRSYCGSSAAAAGATPEAGMRRKAIRPVAERLRNLDMLLPPVGKSAGSAFTLAYEPAASLCMVPTTSERVKG